MVSGLLVSVMQYELYLASARQQRLYILFSCITSTLQACGNQADGRSVLLLLDIVSNIISGMVVFVCLTIAFAMLSLYGALVFHGAISYHYGLSPVFLTRFNNIAIQGTHQMAVYKEAISLSRVYSYDYKCTFPYSMCNPP